MELQGLSVLAAAAGALLVVTTAPAVRDDRLREGV
jgi:hypothetical protein